MLLLLLGGLKRRGRKSEEVEKRRTKGFSAERFERGGRKWEGIGKGWGSWKGW